MLWLFWPGCGEQEWSYYSFRFPFSPARNFYFFVHIGTEFVSNFWELMHPFLTQLQLINFALYAAPMVLVTASALGETLINKNQ